MLVKDFSNVSESFCVCSQSARPSVRRATDFQRMPQSAGDLVLGGPPRHQICTVKSDVLGFGYWVYFLLCHSLSKICVRYDLVQFGKKILMQM
jgi:hypothetical protein